MTPVLSKLPICFAIISSQIYVPGDDVVLTSQVTSEVNMHLLLTREVATLMLLFSSALRFTSLVTYSEVDELLLAK